MGAYIKDKNAWPQSRALAVPYKAVVPRPTFWSNTLSKEQVYPIFP